MKKIILILITLSIFGCTKEDTPKPVSRTQQTTPPQQTQNSVNSIYYDFVGTWKCDNWVVDDFTQSTRRRDFIFSNQTSTLFNASLNQYNLSGSNYNQLFSNASAFVDSNYFDIQKQWTETDFPLSNLPVAGLFEGKLAGNNISQMVVIGDGNFPINGTGQQMQQQQEDNISLMVNSIDFMSDDTGLIELRTKGVTSRPLDQIEDGKKAFLKYFNFLFPLLIIIIYGIVRMQMKRNLRIRRMEEGYV